MWIIFNNELLISFGIFKVFLTWYMIFINIFDTTIYVHTPGPKYTRQIFGSINSLEKWYHTKDPPPLFWQSISMQLSSHINEMKYINSFIPVETLLPWNIICYFGDLFMNKSDMMDNITITAKKWELKNKKIKKRSNGN